MWRTRAVISLLVEEVASLKYKTPDSGVVEDDSGEGPISALDRAGRRARLAVVIDCLAIVVLFLFRDSSRPFLPANQTVETVFTVGVLAIAAHAGFRAAHLWFYRNIARLCEELHQRRGD